MSSAGSLSELDALRSQVADLSRQLAERDRSSQHQREQSDLLRAIVEGTATETGEAFFLALVTHLTSVLHVQYAIIGEVQEDRIKKIRTLAVAAGGALVDNFEYELAHTPCAAALTQGFACFDRDLQATFPQFQLVADLGAVSYCAVPLRTKGGAVSGLLVVMDTKPMEHGGDLQALLEVFAPRVAAEYERRRAEQERVQALADLHNVIETIPDIVFALDTQGNVVKWNRRLGDVTGYSPEELLNKPALAFVPPQEQARTAAAIQRVFMEGYAELEGQLLTKERRLIPYHWAGALLKNSHGEPVGITGIGRDVSEKKWAEEERQKALTFLTNVINNTPDLIFVKDRDLRTVLCNNAFAQASGKPLEDLLGHTDVENGWDPELVYGNLDKGIRGFEIDDREALSGKVMRIPSEPVNVGSEVRMFDTHKVPLRGDTGEVIGVLGIARDITEHKRLDEALRASEERWHLAVRGSNDGIWDWDIQSGTVFFSPRWKAMRGFEEHEITSHVEEWQSRIHSDDLDRVLQNLEAYVAKQAPYYCEEYRTRRKDGSYMWILDRGLALWADDGTPLRMVGSESDITEHKQALLRLVAQESLLRSILDTEPECVNRVADDGTILQMNKAGLCFIESDSFEQVAGRSVYDLVAPEFLEQYRSMHEAVIRGATQQFEFQIVGLKGTRRWMETHAVPLRNPIDHRVEHLAITRDITDRKRAETALRESEERYRTLVDLSPNGVLVYCNGKKVYVNQAACTILRAASPEQLLQNPTFHISHPDDYESIHTSIAQILATGEPARRVERKYQRLDGTAVSVEVDAGCIMWNGEPAVQVIFADITERKQAEKALRESEAFNISVLNSLSSQIVVLNSQGVIMSVNKPWLQFAEENGASHLVESFAGMNYLNVCAQAPQFASGEEAASAQAGILAVLAGTHNEFSLEYPCHSPDQQRWFRMRVTPLLDSQAGVVVAHENITERKLAQEKRYQSEAQFRAILDNSPSLIFLKDLDGRYLRVNREFTTVFRLTSEEVLGRTDRDIFPPEQAAIFQMNDEKVLQGGLPLLFEEASIHGDGQHIAIVHKFPLRDEKGTLYAMGGIVTDITERKQAEEALRQNEERFDLAVRGSNTGIWDWDLRTGKTYFSPLWKNMLGYEEHELKGELFEWERRLHPDDRERSLATVRGYLEGATSQYEVEHRLCHKDGSYRWILARGVSLSDAAGKPYRMAGSHIDITGQKQTQEALAQSERQLRTVLDALPVGVWFTDRGGKMLLANPAAKQIWSNIKQIAPQTENHQAGWWETIGPASEPHRWALSHVLTTGVPSLNEIFDFECLDGTKKTIRNSTIPVNNEDGATLGAIVLNEDITLLRQAQAALQLTQFSVDHAVEGFLWIGPDARIFHVNESTCRMLEYAKEELTTMTLHDIDPNFSSEIWHAHWEELKEKGSLTFESKYWSRTGRVLDMEVTVNYLQYEGREYNCAIMRDIGERKRAHAALHASEERYRSLYDETPNMYFTLAADGTVVSVNRFGAEQLGYQAEELIGHSVLGLFHEEDKETVVASLSECLATPEIARHWEFRKLRKDGSMIWVRETARVDQSSAEEPVVLVTCEDITEHKRTEHESRERIRQATAMQAALLELAHLDDTRQTFSEALPQVTSTVADMLAVERVSLWLLSEDRTELVCQDLYLRRQATHSAGKRLPVSRYPRYCAVLMESLVIAAPNARVDQRTSEFDDDYFPSLGIASVLDVPIRRQGKIVGVLWSEHVGFPREWSHEAQDFAASVGQTIARMIEVAERKQAEEALRKKSQELDRYFTSALDLLCIADVTGHFKRLNKAWESTLGYPLEELEGAKFLDYVHPDDLEATLHALGDLTEEKEVLSFVNRYRRKDGSYRWIEWKSIPAGELIYAAARDITERKRMEDALRARERELQIALQERERISQDLHDGILQSLFGVGLNLEVTKSLMSAKTRKTAGGSLDKSIDQLNRVMREIRNFIAGLGPDPIEGKDLSAALQSMLTSLTENQPTRVRLAVEKRAVQAVSAEQSIHLFRVIQEAVSNCIRHGFAQEARVSLKMLKQGVRLSIRDNGRGFNQDIVKAGGYGLRNMAARAQKISGRFTVLSKENEGTRIILDLPKEASNVSR